MLTVIIASNRNDNLQRVQQNIAETIGMAYQLINIRDLQYGLSKAYNDAASSAVNPFLCFVHDDVLFHTQGWGGEVVRVLQNPDVGVIGVMGGRYKSAFGFSWRDGRESFYRYQVKDGAEGGKHLHQYKSDFIGNEVVCLDGAFLCCRKEVWNQFQFDEKNFTGFHLYDLDFSFRVAQEFQNFVIPQILLEHFSQGTMNKAYAADMLRFNSLHHRRLPFTLESLFKREEGQLEGYTLSQTLRLLKKSGFSLRLRTAMLIQYVRRYKNFYQAVRNLYFGFFKP